MKFNWNFLLSRVRSTHPSGRAFFIGIGVAVLAQWAIVFLGIPRTASSVFLHYSVYFGVDAAGTYAQAFITPAVSTGIAIVNFFLSRYVENIRMRTTFGALTAVCMIYGIISCILLVRINSSF